MGTNAKDVFLTFDDGPTPEITTKVLNILDQFDARATFFCIGRNVERNPEIYEEVVKRGHIVGNHSYSHINGFKTTNDHYFEDIKLAANYIHSSLFRPPYGRIKWSQGSKLLQDYRIIMWDVLSYDFKQNIRPEKCFSNVKRKVRNGSLIVFHDSVKAWPVLQHALPMTLEYLVKNGYCFKTIEFFKN